jgi:hypothetical protein
MQKIGGWNKELKEELEINITPNINTVPTLFNILNNIISDNLSYKNIIQLENYIFNKGDYEIKLTHQFGNEDVYNFEVEVFNHNLDILKICNDNNLVPDLEKKDNNYWKEYNKKVNLDIKNLDILKIKTIIESYLK